MFNAAVRQGLQAGSTYLPKSREKAVPPFESLVRLIRVFDCRDNGPSGIGANSRLMLAYRATLRNKNSLPVAPPVKSGNDLQATVKAMTFDCVADDWTDFASVAQRTRPGPEALLCRHHATRPQPERVIATPPRRSGCPRIPA